MTSPDRSAPPAAPLGDEAPEHAAIVPHLGPFAAAARVEIDRLAGAITLSAQARAGLAD